LTALLLPLPHSKQRLLIQNKNPRRKSARRDPQPFPNVRFPPFLPAKSIPHTLLLRKLLASKRCLTHATKGLARAKNEKAIESASGKLNLMGLQQSLDGIGGDKDTLLALLAADKAKARLSNSAGPKQPKQKKSVTKKQVGEMISVEAKQFDAVVSHPAIRADPFGTVQQHLMNTIAAQKQQSMLIDKIDKLERKVLAKEKVSATRATRK
jgi:hypothetical protein